MKLPIADLHCDLLAFLAADPSRTAQQLEARCSLPDLKAGGVVLQTMAVWTETKPGSTLLASKQIARFKALEKEGFSRLESIEMPTQEKTVSAVASIENASGLVEENEPLEKAFERLDLYQRTAGPLLYITLTWNDENRFGGGNKSMVGLKRDGELFLQHLSGKGIAVDFSHTSDALAHDIFNCIDKHGLSIPVLASHSNFRAVTAHERNLPCEIAKEIFRRNGVIGLNLIQGFVGPGKYEDFRRHIERGLELGGADKLSLGADFFCDTDFPKPPGALPSFFKEFGDASIYPHLLSLCAKDFPKAFLEKLTSQNLSAYFKRFWC